MAKVCRVLILLLCFVFVGVMQGCSTDDACYHRLSDLAGEKVGVLQDVVSHDSLLVEMPGATIQEYTKAITLFVDVEAGRCSAAVVDSVMAADVTESNSDYLSLGNVDGCYVIIPRSNYAMSSRYTIGSEGWWIQWGERLERNLFNSNAARLILHGLYNTVVIFFFAMLLAMALAAFIAYMGINHKWMWLYRPLNAIVHTLHDIPSVVLMMFFYYVVFASSEFSGVAVAAVALGVYASGSLAKIFKVHITQVEREQREAALVLGLKGRQVYRYVILPQAAKSMMPLLGGELKLLLRSTSYAGYIAQNDLVKVADAIRGETFDAFIPLMVISLIYLLLSCIITGLLHRLYKKLFGHG